MHPTIMSLVASKRRARGVALIIAFSLLTVVLIANQAYELTELDSGNLVHGLERFDPSADRPHPPGYPVTVAAAHLLTFLGGSRQAYLGLDLLATLVAVLATGALGSSLFGRRAGIVAGLLMAAVPLILYYGSIVSVYPTEEAMGPIVVLLCWRASHHCDRKAVLALPAALAFAGGLRPTSMELLLPVVAFALMLARPRISDLSVGLALGGICLAAWAVPMFSLVDWNAYWQRSSLLSRTNAADTSLLYGASARQAAVNVALTISGMIGAALPALALVLLRPPVQRRWPRWNLRSPYALLLAWVIPYVLLYAIILFGKPGYAAVLAPVAAVAAAGAVRDRRFVVTSAGSLAAIGLLYFQFFPLPALPWRFTTFVPTAQAIRLEDAEARAAASIGGMCAPPECAVVSLSPSPRLWTHSFDQLAHYYAPETVLVTIENVSQLPPAEVVLWVGSKVPAAVSRNALQVGEAGTWLIFMTTPEQTQRVRDEL